MMRGLLESVVVSVVVLSSCSSDDAGESPDATTDANPGPRDAGSDTARTDAGWSHWSGTEVPPPTWTLPPCAVAYDAIDRVVTSNGSRIPGEALPPRITATAARDGRLVLAWNGGWGTVDGGAYRSLPEDDVHRGRGLSGVSVDAAAARALSVTSEGMFLVEASDVVRIVEVALGEIEPRTGQWTHRATSGEIDAIALLYEPTASDYLLAAGRLTTDGTLVGTLRWLGERPFYDDQHKLVVVEDGGRYLTVRTFECDTCDPPADIEIVPFDVETVGTARTLGSLPGLNEHYIQHITAARDGDVAVIAWGSAPNHPPLYTVVAEVDMGTGATVAEPYVLGTAHGPEQLTSSPGGGVDLVRQPVTPDEVWFDELLNTDNPLEVYIGIERPLSLDGHTPLRLGAGAWGWNVQTARDGDRLLVVWEEQGPATERDERGNRLIVQGLYWAILEGCAPTR